MKAITLIVASLLSLCAWSQNLNSGEYFFDTDPGVGNATSLPSFSPNDTIDLNLNINTTGLTPGFHQLYIRFRDAANKWGIYEGRTFHVQATSSAPTAAPLVASAEFYFDTDPGVGNGIPLPSFSPDDTVDLSLSLNVSALSSGLHQLYIRFKDAANKWGIYEGGNFNVLTCNAPIVNFTPSTNSICLGDTLFLTDISTSLDPSPIYSWDINNDGSVESTTQNSKYKFPTVGTFDIKLKIQQGQCLDSIIKTITVNPNYSSAQAVEICSGNTYTFPDNTTQTNITADVTHTSTLQSSLGCDSIIVTTVIVNPVYNQSNNVTVCIGGTYTFPDNTTQTNITATVSQTSTLQSSLGCDSIIVTTLNVNPVYNLTASAFVCSGGSFTFPDNTTQSNITSTVTQTSNLQSSLGCDSIIVTTVNVNPTYNQTANATICSGGSFTFPDNSTQTNITSTVSQTSTLQSSLGCDSIIVTTINVNPTYNQTVSVSICSGSSFTFPDKTTQTNITASMSQTSTFQSSLGCDSIIVTTVNVNPTYNQTASTTVCTGGSYTFPDNTTQTNITATVTQTSSLQSSLGCDSIIITTVNVKPTYNQTASATICSGSSFTFPDNTTQTNITATVSQTSTLQSILGCDSIIVTIVNVNPTYNQTANATVCSGDSFTFPDNTTQTNITSTVTQTSSLQSSLGCDSIIVTTINVTSIDKTLAALNNTMTANQNGATYQWFTCVGNVLTPISGATNQSYTTSISGNYSVEITLNGCKDTSSCYAHIGVGIDNLTIQNNLFIFPNPNNGDFKVKSDNPIMEGQLKIRTMSGQVVYINRSNGFEFSIDLEVNSGVYLIEINTENSRLIKKLIIR
jgi:PKD repeat protein